MLAVGVVGGGLDTFLMPIISLSVRSPAAGSSVG